ncbi:MAG: hypothetical protein K0S70_4251 [Microbacterium sp.]|nr:hypothetical protein [Microbacterium sp.]MDQ1074690.1 hypothetical protein [Microbacterium sp. SORGH_AS_0969]MDQ1114915.1 hypothetical protein [Microbacterium testaceum]
MTTTAPAPAARPVAAPQAAEKVDLAPREEWMP